MINKWSLAVSSSPGGQCHSCCERTCLHKTIAPRSRPPAAAVALAPPPPQSPTCCCFLAPDSSLDCRHPYHALFDGTSLLLFNLMQGFTLGLLLGYNTCKWFKQSIAQHSTAPQTVSAGHFLGLKSHGWSCPLGWLGTILQANSCTASHHHSAAIV
jgi:hypothetical protein